MWEFRKALSRPKHINFKQTIKQIAQFHTSEYHLDLNYFRVTLGKKKISTVEPISRLHFRKRPFCTPKHIPIFSIGDEGDASSAACQHVLAIAVRRNWFRSNRINPSYITMTLAYVHFLL